MTSRDLGSLGNPPDEGVAIACGTVIADLDLAGGAVALDSGLTAYSSDGLRASPSSVDVVAESGSSGDTVSFPTALDVWFLAPATDPDTNAAGWLVVGHGFATINRGDPLALARFGGSDAAAKGLDPATIAFSDVTYCGAEDAPPNAAWITGIEVVSSSGADTTSEISWLWYVAPPESPER
jgi:hypothetical protein